MTDVVHVIGLKEFQLLLNRHIRKKERDFKNGVRQAIRHGVEIVKRNTPKAFGELRESEHATEDGIVIEAPHAAAVERGARPHWVPLDELEKWVRLRHIQGVRIKSGLERRRSSTIGTTTRRQARSILNEMSRYEASGSSYDNAITEVAKAIQAGIAKNGTAPHFYVRESLPKLEADLDKHMKKAADKSIA